MPSLSSQCTWDRFRMVIFRDGGSAVLLIPNDTRFILPEVEMPAYTRVAENLTSSVQREYGQKIVCLFPLQTENPSANPYACRYYLAEAVGGRDHPAASTWVALDSLNLESFVHATDYDALRRSLDRCGSDASHPEASPFEKLGWLAQLQAWIAQTIQPFGLRLLGPFRQLTASPSFSLIRFDTDGPPVWFKAVGQSNLHESAITRFLAERFKDYLPRILAFHPAWTAWLMQHMSDITLHDAAQPGVWCSAMSCLARLQTEAISHTDDLLAAGCPDLRIQRLIDGCDPFFEHAAMLMKEQTKIPPRALSRQELSDLSLTVKRALASLEAIGIPETLGHSDLNPGNILVLQDRCVFTDWAEAYVGHPFFSFEYLRRAFRRCYSEEHADEPTLTSAYLEAWAPVLAANAARDALTCTPLLATFAYALRADAWRSCQPNRQHEGARWVRSLTRTMREQARSLCEYAQL